MNPQAATTGPTLEALFDAESRAVFGFLLARCGSRALAEDLTGETFLDASRHVAANGSAAKITRSWLLTVARRRLIDHWRKSGSMARRLDWLRTERREEEPPDSDPDGAVELALNSLSPRQRAVLVLRYLDDHSVTEVAETLGMGYRATESLLARARRSFADAYGRELEAIAQEFRPRASRG